MDEMMGSSTFPQAFGYDDQEVVREEGNQDFQDDFLQLKSKSPRVLIMGLRRSGKSSIQKVIFNKMSPNETLFLESTNRISKGNIYNYEIHTSSFVSFSIWNFPGQMDSFDQNFSDDTFAGVSKGALVFVIDAQDEYSEALNTLINVIQRVYKLNQNILFEVFIHKIDCVSDENKFEIQKDIFSIKDDLIDIDLEFIKINYHLTSIYDHSIYEAFSKVVQKLIPQLDSLEHLLNLFISTCRIEKAFLFDVLSKIYIATDGSPVDMQSYELCCEMIDVVIDISNLYSVKETGEPNPFDKNSASIIKLNNQTVLYLREVNNYLALVCILREDCFDRQGVIDYNFQCFKDAINEIFSKPISEASKPESTPLKLTD